MIRSGILRTALNNSLALLPPYFKHEQVRSTCAFRHNCHIRDLSGSDSLAPNTTSVRFVGSRSVFVLGN
jgi:hypothetical protein